MNAVTLGEPKKLYSMLGWVILEFMLRGSPYGILLFVVWELFIPLQNPGTPVNYSLLGILVIVLFINLILLHIVGKRAYLKTFSDTYDIGAEGRLKVGDHIRKMSMGFFNANDPGKLGAYMLHDYGIVEYMVSHQLPTMIGGFFMPLILLSFLAFIHFELFLVAVSVLPLTILMVILTGKLIARLGKGHHAVVIDTTSRMLEYVNGMKVIKSFNLIGTRFERMENTFRKLMRVSIRLEASAGPSLVSSSSILHLGLTLIIIFGLTFVFAGSLSLPFYILFLVLGSRVYTPLLASFTQYVQMRYLVLSAYRIESLLKEPILVGSNPDVKPERYDIEFDDVTFHYHDTDVIKNVSLKIPEKSLVALVGPSGSGKTTMTRLIARFWDVNEGKILLDGRDLREYAPEVILASISMVFQDVYLFNDSVTNNIRVGKKDATEDDIIAAAKKARCHDFIMELPDGYDTVLAEGGASLSAGERQRISIARAILKDAPIILLDEATASLDPENEVHIQEAIEGLVENKTVVIIAHRLYTIVGADRVFVFDEGELKEEGTHEELMEMNGLFRQMWDEQQSIRNWSFGGTRKQMPLVKTSKDD
jgi:ATP-binding cassette subfamily B protein